jgi:hypothetical protein
MDVMKQVKSWRREREREREREELLEQAEPV